MAEPDLHRSPRRVRARPRAVTAALLAAAIAACALYLAALFAARPGEAAFPLDDSWIHLALGRSLAEGGGLALNPGELVPASTAPLWTALVAVLFPLPNGILLWIAAAGALLYLATVHATLALARELDLGEGLAALAAALTLATGWMVWSALSGLEIPLFTTLSLWGMTLHLRERRLGAPAPRSVAVLAAACLARPEGLLLLALALGDRWLRWRRLPSSGGGEAGGLALVPRLQWRETAVALAVAAAALGPVAVWNLAVGGSPLPTTFAAKAGGAHAWWPGLGHLWTALQILFRSQPASVLAAGAGVLALVARLGGPRDRGLLPALWLVSLPLALAALSPAGGPLVAGNFGRYFFPLFPVLAVVAAAGLEGAARALGPRLTLGRLRLPLRAALAVALLLPTVASLARGAGRYVQSVGNVADGDVAAARWLAPRLRPGAVVAVNDIGALKVHLPGHRVVDLAGIAHPELGGYLAEAAAAGRERSSAIEAFLRDRGVDVLVVFPSWFPGLAADARYRRVRRFEIPDNITLGGDQIWILETPWSRAPLAGGSEPDEEATR